LHFSGHGYPNNVKSIGENFWATTQGGGSFCLLLETNHQSSVFKTEHQLLELLQSTNQLPKFVFLASCYSEAFGRIFSNVGIEHVICIDEKTAMLDQVAIEFANVFYRILFKGEDTVVEAFYKTRNLLLSQTHDDFD
jgi:hypothetical protein